MQTVANVAELEQITSGPKVRICCALNAGTNACSTPWVPARPVTDDERLYIPMGTACQVTDDGNPYIPAGTRVFTNR